MKGSYSNTVIIVLLSELQDRTNRKYPAQCFTLLGLFVCLFLYLIVKQNTFRKVQKKKLCSAKMYYLKANTHVTVTQLQK